MPRSIFGSYCETEPEVTPEVSEQLRWKLWVDAQLWMHAQQLRWTPQLTSAIARDSVLLIVRYVGAHNLEAFWTCSECKPYWYNWYCRECKRVNNYRHWTPRLHYGHYRAVGLTLRQSCGCCRSEHRDSFPCEACDDLWELKGTCHTMRNLVKTYNGT